MSKTFHHKPTFGGNQTGAIQSDGTTVSGTGTVSVRNRGEDEVFRVDNPSRTKTYVGAYGTLVVQRGGGWVYTLDTANPAVSGLATAATLTDTFKVRTRYLWRNRFFPVVITITGA